MKSFIGKTAFILGLLATTLVARASNLDSILVVPQHSAFPAFILQTQELQDETQVRIWDANGGLVWSEKVSPKANNKLFNLRHLEEGRYDVEMDNDHVFISQKLDITNGKATIVSGSTETVLFPEILPGKIYRFVLEDFGKGTYDVTVAADGKYRSKTIYR